MICAACRLVRDPADLLVFWPQGQPEVRRFVCRPTCPSNASYGPCFGQVVGPMNVHGIALVERAPLEALEPIRPLTPAWHRILREAGVRAA